MSQGKNTQQIDSLWINANIIPMTLGSDNGRIEKGCIGISDGKIAFLGKEKDLDPQIKKEARAVYDVQGKKWITPGLIDCHTHLVYGGNRAGEFEKRLSGMSYEQIASEGGGIRSTVEATRKADESSLYQQSLPRLLSLMNEGVTTVEIKSGYGLDKDTELKMLYVAKQMGNNQPVRVIPTFLGAHAVPPEFAGRDEAYIDFVCREVLPIVVTKKLAVAVDVFCETIGFSYKLTERMLKAAKKYGLSLKIHAEQFSDNNGAALAARYGALSADHLEYLSKDAAKIMAEFGTVAVLLPGAFYYLKMKKKPPIELFRKLNVPMAVSTDCNPGSSPVGSILSMMNMSCVLFGLTPLEALAGVTKNAARALGLQDEIGSLEVGKCADFAVWDINGPEDLAYSIGFNPLVYRIYKGQITHQAIRHSI